MRSLMPHFGSREPAAGDAFSQLQHEVDRLFGDFSRSLSTEHWPFAKNGPLSLRVDVCESNKAVEVSAELPGVEEKDIDVSLDDDKLTIKAEKKAEKESKDKTWHTLERSYGSVQRTIGLPFAVDPDKVEAKFEKGVLKITLPKPPESERKSRNIKIKGA